MAPLPRNSGFEGAGSLVEQLRGAFLARSEFFSKALLGLAVFLFLDAGAIVLDRAGSASAATASVGSVPMQLGSTEAAAVGAPPELLAPQPAPTNVAIPAIEVDTALVDLHVTDGELSVPADYSKAGWWTEGVVPGQVGPAVVVGHVDSTKAAAVFYRVRQLKGGDLIDVTRADGSVVSFRVDAVEQFPKDQFPTARIYGPTSAPTLRLITCGGRFDKAARQYEDNVIVFATIVPPSPRSEALVSI